jgi:hypothetical protein
MTVSTEPRPPRQAAPDPSSPGRSRIGAAQALRDLITMAKLRTRARVALIITMCIALIGCEVTTSPTTVSQWDRRHALSMRRAPWDGQYTLSQVPADPKSPAKVIHSMHLKKGEELGFRQRETGVVAVADDSEIPIGPGEYQWVLRADPGQTDGVATTILITAIVVVLLTVGAFLIEEQINQSGRGLTHKSR